MLKNRKRPLFAALTSAVSFFSVACADLTVDPIPTVLPERETQAVNHADDAADDPAIWVNRANPSDSRILGTNKKGSLEVYDLTGRKLQVINTGRINNIDLRNNLAIATQRDRNSLLIFSIDESTGEVSVAGEIPAQLENIYGICLYQPAAEELHVFVNGKSGEYQQIRITANEGVWQGERLRTFSVASQPEGCVADDLTHRLYFGEEDRGIWTMDARADSTADPQPVMMAGKQLVADVEGMALYHGKKQAYLIASSQGNNSYVVLEAAPPYRYRGSFQVGNNDKLAIDGTSETDGLEAISVSLGAPFENGLLVVQDGHNQMPDENQNFKLVPWTSVAQTLSLE